MTPDRNLQRRASGSVPRADTPRQAAVIAGLDAAGAHCLPHGEVNLRTPIGNLQALQDLLWTVVSTEAVDPNFAAEHPQLQPLVAGGRTECDTFTRYIVEDLRELYGDVATIAYFLAAAVMERGRAEGDFPRGQRPAEYRAYLSAVLHTARDWFYRLDPAQPAGAPDVAPLPPQPAPGGADQDADSSVVSPS